MREESDRLVKLAMAQKVAVAQDKTGLDVKCSMCGAPSQLSADSGKTRGEYKFKECSYKQKTL